MFSLYLPDVLLDVVGDSVDDLSVVHFVLERTELVDQTLERFDRGAHAVIIGSPPATGKSSLLSLLQWRLQDSHKVLKLSCLGVTAEKLIEVLKENGVDLQNQPFLQNCVRRNGPNPVYVLIDDAQDLRHDDVDGVLWGPLLKVKVQKLRYIIASTYDLGARSLWSPTSFEDQPHVSFEDMLVTRDESRQLLVHAHPRRAWGDWNRVHNYLHHAGKPHDADNTRVGVFQAGILALRDAAQEKSAQYERLPAGDERELTETEAMMQLQSAGFIRHLKRSFKVLQDSKAVNMILSLLRPEKLSSHLAAPATDSCRIVKVLQRVGILVKDGDGFACPAAETFYYNHLFPLRPSQRPDTLLELVKMVVTFISASRLHDAHEEGHHQPKEATYQHVFNEALARSLPLANTFLAEKSVPREGHADGSVDFFINGDVKWALELVRGRSNVAEHVARFVEDDGKYAQLGVTLNAWLVVVCHTAHNSQMKKDTTPGVCTLYFDTAKMKCKLVCGAEETDIDLMA